MAAIKGQKDIVVAVKNGKSERLLTTGFSPWLKRNATLATKKSTRGILPQFAGIANLQRGYNSRGGMAFSGHVRI